MKSDRDDVGALTLFKDLNQILEALVGMSRDVLGSNFVGAYLQGSLATGGFDRHSDCDFVIVIDEDMDQWTARRLEAAYQDVYDLPRHWAKHLEGSFFPREILRDYRQAGREIWYLDHGHRVLERSAHDNTVVVRWILREGGISLTGPLPVDLIDPIPVRDLRAEMYRIFKEWGETILADPQEIGSRFYQTFAVLSYCRFLHNLQAGTVTSKRAGADWALANLDPAWRELIDRAWAGRPDPAISSRTPADPDELTRTIEFVEMALQLADQMVHNLSLT